MQEVNINTYLCIKIKQSNNNEQAQGLVTVAQGSDNDYIFWLDSNSLPFEFTENGCEL